MRLPVFKWIVATLRNRRFCRVATVEASDKNEAYRKAVIAFPTLDVVVFSRPAWENKEPPPKKRSGAAVEDEQNAEVERSDPPSHATRAASRAAYEQLKADYYAGKPVQISNKMREQLEDFRPRKEIGPLLHEIQTNHRSKPIGTHKWRPTAVDMDRVCDILEHQDDHEQETK